MSAEYTYRKEMFDAALCCHPDTSAMCTALHMALAEDRKRQRENTAYLVLRAIDDMRNNCWPEKSPHEIVLTKLLYRVDPEAHRRFFEMEKDHEIRSI